MSLAERLAHAVGVGLCHTYQIFVRVDTYYRHWAERFEQSRTEAVAMYNVLLNRNIN